MTVITYKKGTHFMGSTQSQVSSLKDTFYSINYLSHDYPLFTRLFLLFFVVKLHKTQKCLFGRYSTKAFVLYIRVKDVKKCPFYKHFYKPLGFQNNRNIDTLNKYYGFYIKINPNFKTYEPLNFDWCSFCFVT